MLSESFQQFLKGVSAAAGFVLMGALVALVLSGFQGQFELELGKGEGRIKVIGAGDRCELRDASHRSHP